MTISLLPGLEAERPVRPSYSAEELREALYLAKQLCNRLSTPIEDERAHGVRWRLVRAHALSVVDLLTDITGNGIRMA